MTFAAAGDDLAGLDGSEHLGIDRQQAVNNVRIETLLAAVNLLEFERSRDDTAEVIANLDIVAAPARDLIFISYRRSDASARAGWFAMPHPADTDSSRRSRLTTRS